MDATALKKQADLSVLLEKFRKHQDEIASLRANLKSELEKAVK